MPLVQTDVNLVGRTLEDDVFTSTGSLLLSTGMTLTTVHIYSLLRNGIFSVRVSLPEQKNDSAYMSVVTIEGQLEKLSYDHETAASYVKAMELTKGLFDKVTEDSIPSLREFGQAFFPVAEQVLKRTGIFRPLYALEGSDSYTYRHSINVGMLSALIAKLMNQSDEDIILIGQAGFLHDVGKMLVPKEILMKPGKLTKEEYEQMKMHTVYGHELIAKMEGAPDMLAKCALMHHERMNGTGYPLGLKGDAIPFACQIIAVADQFDAICSDRVYKERTSPFVAAQILWQSACEGHLNPEIVTKFAHYIVSLYAGSKAVLNTGEEVEVVFIHKDEPMRPLVRRGEDFFDLRSHRVWDIEKMIV
ncbi:MAG: HD-GYP domain-containing protein [Clostridia bacterium]